MKVVFQSFIASIIIHLTYLAGTLLFGFIKTKIYKPSIVSSYENVNLLQSEISFGGGGYISPILLITFFGVAFICWIIIMLSKKLLNSNE
jgi:hypothetical protein